jgi:hypothetical protein
LAAQAPDFEGERQSSVVHLLCPVEAGCEADAGRYETLIIPKRPACARRSCCRLPLKILGAPNLLFERYGDKAGAESAARATAADRNGAAVWRSNTGALGQLANKNVAGSGALTGPFSTR